MPKKKSVWVIGETKKISEDYELGPMIGQPGQFGHAQRCTHRATGYERAVKVVKKSQLSRESISVLKSEVEIMQQLQHENIIQWHEVFESKRHLYMVMELCEGGELFDRIKEKSRYSEQDAAQIIRQAFEALAYMHDRNIAHCDIKPDNLLFLTNAEDSPLKLIDFGMSKFIRRREFHHTICGTLMYMAPEIYAQHYTKHCDMWSMGVVMFIMLFGYPCFHGSDRDIGHAIQKGFTGETRNGYRPGCFPSSIPCSDAAKDLITKLLDSDPVSRLSAREALEHPWMTGKEASDTPILTSVISKMGEFTTRSRFKHKIVSRLTQEVDEKDLQSLRQAFEAVDVNHDGSLTGPEIKAALESNPDLLDAKVQTDLQNFIDAAVTAADIDGDGAISYEELLHASVQAKLMAKEDRLWQTFRELDLDGNGTLSAEEVARVLDIESDTELEELIKEADHNGDGVIDYVEFLSIWHKQLPPEVANDMKEHKGK